MALTILDPAKQAQLQTDMREGRVPAWNPNNEAAANAFAAYFNALVEQDVMTIEAHTTYTFKITNPEG